MPGAIAPGFFHEITELCRWRTAIHLRSLLLAMPSATSIAISGIFIKRTFLRQKNRADR